MSNHSNEQQGVNVLDSVTQDLFRYSADASLTVEQIKEHVDEFVQDPDIHLFFGNQPVWSSQEYMDKLTTIPDLMDLVKTPYLLAVTLRVLPKVVGPRQDLVGIRIVRVDLYDKFVEQWFALSLERLESSVLSSVEREALTDLIKDGFVTQGINFLKRLADSIFTRQSGDPVLRYIHTRDKDTWKAEAGPTDVQSLDPDCPLLRQNLLSEVSVLRFLSERVQKDSGFEVQLREVIERSKSDPFFATATANAITILIRAGLRFIGADLRGIRFPGANFSGEQFDYTQFQGIDLAGVNLARSWLRQMDANFSPISHFAFSSTSHQLAISNLSGVVSVYDTQTRTLLKTITLEDVEVSILTYSPTDQQLAVGAASRDSIHLWDLKSDESVVQLGLNDAVSEGVKCIAFSLCGNWIASGYAGDKTVRLWHRRRLQSGNTVGKDEVGSWRSVPMPSGFFDTVTSISWNLVKPLEIVTCSQDHSVRVWRILDHGDGKDFTVRMLWGTNLGQLHVSGLVSGNVAGLGPVYEKLLVQGGGVNESWSVKEEALVSEE
ncbi:hypothetical protein KI688_005273 [Linnemannia hyalina]|uniref:WD40 repeat-like protein n=1 Tax=Linnemannia hyalina TaxID=64524 RepID=A0A9P7XKV8_9FUNG|nr:hypothetical protein KI688_005273 [Linnemannia hyalina]